jgi:hypothetical protein
MISPASSSQVLVPQVPIAYSHQHSDHTHTLKTISLLKTALEKYCQAKNKS